MPRRADNRRAHAVPNGLGKHIAHHNEPPQRDRRELQPQRQRANADHLRVLPPESRHNRPSKNERNAPQHQQNHRRHLHAEPKRLPHPLILPRAVAETAYRLEPLAKPDHRRVHEHDEPAADRHGRNSRVAIHARSIVEQDGRHAGNALPPQGWKPIVKNPPVHLRGGLEPPGRDRDSVFMQRALEQQDQKAHRLGDRRGDGRAGNAQVQAEDQQRVQQHVKNAAGGDANHAVQRQPLKPQEIVQHQRPHHKRRGIEDVHRIGARVGHDGLRRAEETHQRIDTQIPQHGDHHTRAHRCEEAHRAIGLGLLVIARAQGAADVGAAAHAQREGHGLNNRHSRKNHAHRAGGGGADLADKIGIRHIVNIGNEHR